MGEQQKVDAAQDKKPPSRRMRLIRRSAVFWEKTGVLVSCVATILAAATVWTSLRQTDLMAVTLNAGERNSAFLSLTGHLEDYCTLATFGYANYITDEEVLALRSKIPNADKLKEKDLAVKKAIKLLMIVIEQEKEEALEALEFAVTVNSVHLLNTENADAFRLRFIFEHANYLCASTSATLFVWFKRGERLLLPTDT